MQVIAAIATAALQSVICNRKLGIDPSKSACTLHQICQYMYQHFCAISLSLWQITKTDRVLPSHCRNVWGPPW